MLLTSSTGISKRLARRQHSSTLYYYFVYKEKASGKKHSRSRVQLSEITACSHRADGVLSPGTRITLLCTSPACRQEVPLAITASAADPDNQGSQQQRKKNQMWCSLWRGRHLCAKDGICPLERGGSRSPHSSKIQLQITERHVLSQSKQWS